MALIDDFKDTHSVRMCCRLFGVSRSVFYESAKRHKARVDKDAPLVADIEAVHNERFKSGYGSPRMSEELSTEQEPISRNRVERVMREYKLSARKKKRFVKTTDSAHALPVAENLLSRNFATGQTHGAWACDITYLRVGNSFMYLAAVIDLGTRKWVGYALQSHMRSSLICDALDMALMHEQAAPEWVHSDRGSQYASGDHRAQLSKRGIALSMSRRGNRWDNAVAESFFGSFKGEAGDTFFDNHDVQETTFDYFNFYNNERIHSAIGYTTPAHYQKQLLAASSLAAN